MKILQKGLPGGKMLGAGLTVSGLLLLSSHGMAQTVSLTSGGSVATVNLSGANAGMTGWSVPGSLQSQLNLQWFYYSINGGAVQAINGISAPVFNQFGNPNFLDVTYANSQVSIDIQYTLLGTGMGSADITESIFATNPTGSDYQLNLFEYSNFNLLQSGNNSIQVFADGNSGYNFVRQTSGGTAIQEGITSPDANFTEANGAAQTLADVMSGNNLNNSLTAGPGNVAWAFQWNPTVAKGTEYDILKDKSLSIQMVPEPSTLALMALGLSACGLVRRRRSS